MIHLGHGVLDQWRQRARSLKADTYALYLACRDPRVPWYAKLLAATVVAYAFSPIDLIPDFVPVLGYLDDLVIVPLGIALAVKLIPAPILRSISTRRGWPWSVPPTGWRPGSSLQSGYCSGR